MYRFRLIRGAAPDETTRSVCGYLKTHRGRRSRGALRSQCSCYCLWEGENEGDRPEGRRGRLAVAGCVSGVRKVHGGLEDLGLGDFWREGWPTTLPGLRRYMIETYSTSTLRSTWFMLTRANYLRFMLYHYSTDCHLRPTSVPASARQEEGVEDMHRKQCRLQSEDWLMARHLVLCELCRLLVHVVLDDPCWRCKIADGKPPYRPFCMAMFWGEEDFALPDGCFVSRPSPVHARHCASKGPSDRRTRLRQTASCD